MQVRDQQSLPPEAMFFLGVNTLGGAELSMSLLARTLHARGVRTEFAVYGSRRDLIYSHGGDVPVNELATNHTWSSIFPLIRLLRRKRPAVLIAALHHTNIAAIIAALLARTDTRIIVTMHSSAYMEFAAYKGRLSLIMMPAIRLLYPLASAIVTVSKGLAREAHSFLPARCKVHVVYNPVIGNASHETLPPAHPWLEEGAPPVMMGIGRLSREKDFTAMLRAFAEISKTREMRLIILGEGAQRPALEALAAELGVSDRVLLPGFIARMGAWLPYASLFVSTSEHEGFGNAIVEAMAHKVPVVVVDCPFGPAEILEGGRFGRLVPLNDAGALTQAIEEALADPGDLAAARTRAGRFSVSRCGDDYLALMQQVAAPSMHAEKPVSVSHS